MRLTPACLLLLLALFACGDDDDSPNDSGGLDGAQDGGNDGGLPLVDPCNNVAPVAGEPNLTLQDVITSGLSQPIALETAPGDPRLFIVEKTGAIRIYENGGLLVTPFLTIDVATVSEQGLLGLAFHPDYAQNGRFFVHYSEPDDGNTQISEFTVSNDPNLADAESERPLLSATQPYPNHNGGQISFGPDGFLYIGLGDGGLFNDPNDAGQTLSTFLGKMLRIDVDSGEPYASAAGNPGLATPEIWAYGLRNPWKFSFDGETGDLYIADVGQDSWEEVNVQPASSTGGENYGWRITEGKHCSPFIEMGCTLGDYTLPVWDSAHGEDDRSITGGYVYRGCLMPGHRGKYFFGDYELGWVKSFKWNGTSSVTDEESWSSLAAAGLAAFGQDDQGELYVVSLLAGTVQKIVPAE